LIGKIAILPTGYLSQMSNITTKPGWFDGKIRFGSLIKYKKIEGIWQGRSEGNAMFKTLFLLKWT
jgi:hypothetical protein